jgi:hypothetical protein
MTPERERSKRRHAWVPTCIGVGEGIAVVAERV